MHFDSRADAAKWVIQNQDGRRNLTLMQKVEVALKVEAMFARQAKEKQGSHTDLLTKRSKGKPVHTRDEIGKLAGVGSMTVHRVKTVLEHADPEVVEQVRRGEVSAMLSRIEEARAIIRKGSLRDVLEVKNQADLVRAYTAKHDHLQEASVELSEVAVSATRRAGEILAGMEKAAPGQHWKKKQRPA